MEPLRSFLSTEGLLSAQERALTVEMLMGRSWVFLVNMRWKQQLCSVMFRNERVCNKFSFAWMHERILGNGIGDLFRGLKSIWHCKEGLCIAVAGCCGCLRSAGIRTSKQSAVSMQQWYSNKLIIVQLQCKLLHVLNINKCFSLLCTQSIEGKWIVALLGYMNFNMANKHDVLYK
jgi:hypothetical protein